MTRQQERADALARAIDAGMGAVGEPAADDTLPIDAATARTIAALRALADAAAPPERFVAALEDRLLAGRVAGEAAAPLAATSQPALPPRPAAMDTRATDTGGVSPGRGRRPTSRARAWLLAGGRRAASLAAALLLLAVTAGALALVLPGVLRRGVAPPGAAPVTATPSPFPFALAPAVLLRRSVGQPPRADVRPVDPATGQDVPGFAPIVAGEGTMLGAPQALSADGRTLAIVVTEGSSCEGSLGGTACRARGDALRLVDVPAWRETTVPLPKSGWVAALAFSPNAERLALAYIEPAASTIMLFDAKTGATLAQRAVPFRPSLLAFATDGTTVVAYGQAPGGNGGMLKPDPPRLALLDAATLEPRREESLPGITSGVWCIANCASNPWEGAFASWTPAVALAPGGRALYIAHADEDGLTVFDLESPQARMVALGGTHGNGTTGASKAVAFSPDGRLLYMIGRTLQAAPNRRQNTAALLGLRVIEAASGRPLAGGESAATAVAVTADGAHLLLSNPAEGWTEVLDATTLARVARLEGWEVLPARRLDGQPILLASRREPGGGQVQLATLDPRTFAIAQSWSPGGYAAWVVGP